MLWLCKQHIVLDWSLFYMVSKYQYCSIKVNLTTYICSAFLALQKNNVFYR